MGRTSQCEPDRSLKVCFFNRSYYPDCGATGQLLTELAEGLAEEHDCRVVVVAGPAGSAGGRPNEGAGLWPFRREMRRGVDIVRARGTRFGRGHFLGRFANYLSYFFTAFLAGLTIRRPDVVVSLTDPPIIGLAAWFTAWRTQAKFVFLCQDVFPEVASLLEDFESHTVNAILRRVNRFLIARADHIVVLGETMGRRLVDGKGGDPSKISVIHNWADGSSFRTAPKRNPFSEAHGMEERFVVMHSGNVGLSQKLDTLVEAAEYLRREPDILVAIVGEGVKKSELEEVVRSRGLTNVRFFPYQAREALGDSFGAADVFVVSLAKGLAGYIVPSKLYGILAAGKPYVAAVEEECEVWEITRRFDSGLLVSPGDARGLAEKILSIYRDPALARRLGENARRAATRFDRPAQIAVYHRLFRRVVNARSVLRPTPTLKRLFDVILSGLGLLFSLPLWGILGLAIKLEDGGPIFYSQYRVGRGGKVFKSWKFRSMIPDADERFGPAQATEHDPRVTGVGRVMRATAMDELPQLWNIFRGDMSFVGPRALASKEIEVNSDGNCVALAAIPGFEERHAVLPGLTGVAQVFAARDIPRRQKFRYDRLYVHKQSFWLDLKLIIVSFWITFRGRWEARGEKL